MKIATHLLVKNNEATIERAILSLAPLRGEVIVGDLGSEDNTIHICEKLGATVIDLKFNKDYSQMRNKLVDGSGSPWQLYIEPWEILASGHDIITNVEKPGVYAVQVLQGDIITKESRLWHKTLQLKFIQPAFETLNNKTQEQLLPGVVIFSVGTSPDNRPNEQIVTEWMQSNPLASEPCYYRAFVLLSQKKFQEFVVAAEGYLFRETMGMPAIMMQYYLAMVQLYLGDTQKAVRGAIACIATRPLMAEFWCLLGDIYYKTKLYHRAILYYENAMILGRRRLQSDSWPVEISKYKKYPTCMIESCNNIVNNSKMLQSSVRQ